MKLFFTIFGAILAAAGVIFGITSYQQNVVKEKAMLEKIAVSICENAKALVNIVESAKDFDHYLEHGSSHIDLLEKIVRLRQIDRSYKPSIESFIEDTETILKVAREDSVEKGKLGTPEASLKKLKGSVAAW